MTHPPRATYTATPCPACRSPKPSRLVLCGTCWDQLPTPARRALNRRDNRTLARLRALHAFILSGRPLAELEIAS